MLLIYTLAWILIPLHLLGTLIWFWWHAYAAVDSRRYVHFYAHSSPHYARRARRAFIWEWVLIEDLFDLLQSMKDMEEEDDD